MAARPRRGDSLDENLLQALPDAVLTASPEGRVTAANEAARALMANRGGLVGSTVEELLPFVARPPLAESSGGGAAVWQGNLIDATGTDRDLEVVRREVCDSAGEPVFLHVIHDVSHYMALARNREVLLDGAAHELRNPVTALENTLDLLASEAATMSAVEFKRLLDLASRTAARLTQLTEGLLSAATIRSGNLQVSVEPCRLSQLADFALDGVALIIHARSQTVERDLADDLWVLADQRFGPRVLANLLTNASKYSPRGGVIRLRADRLGEDVRVSVEDRGPGIPPDQIDGLFERYYRAHRDHEEPGIGLGLAIARGIVEALGGTIGVTSDLGVGTTVWFTLPASDPPAVTS